VLFRTKTNSSYFEVVKGQLSLTDHTYPVVKRNFAANAIKLQRVRRRPTDLNVVKNSRLQT